MKEKIDFESNTYTKDERKELESLYEIALSDIDKLITKKRQTITKLAEIDNHPTTNKTISTNISKNDINITKDYIEDELIVCNIGVPCKELYAVKDRAQNFYMIGSMGLASSIGLGLAKSRPEKEIVINKLENISNRKEINNRIYTGFNLFNKDDIRLFNILADAGLLINGFTNKILRSRYFKDEDDFNSKKIRNKTTRLIDKLRKHGIIKKVGSASKYYVTENGRKIINYFMLYQNKEIPEFLSKNN